MKFLPLASVIALAALPGAAVATSACQNETFDLVSAPALPPGWTSVVTTGAPTTAKFTTKSVNYDDTAPNAAWLDDTNDYADVSLYSASYGVGPSGSPSVTFQHSYFLWAPDSSPLYSGVYDGAVLEISMNGAAFVDLTTAGGSFSVGGYDSYLDNTFSNPLAPAAPFTRAVWGGSSGAFKTTTAVLPSSALGKTVQFRWRLGTAGGGRGYDTHAGWWIDSFAYSNLGDVLFADDFEDACR